MKDFFKKIKRQIALNMPAVKGQAKAKDIVDILKKPIENFDKLTDQALTRNRQSQVKKDDLHFDLIKKEGEYYLSRLKDQTLGFVHESQIEKLNLSGKELRKSVKEYYVKIRLNLDEAVNKYFDSPYLLGGTTEQGIDCSGLMQRIFREVYGLELPKHSKDQAKKGRTVKNLNNLKQGDLIFFAKMDNDEISHVGFVLDSDKKIIFHAAENTHNKVVKEPLEEMAKRYRIVVVKRILK